jgi:hypothetical protein
MSKGKNKYQKKAKQKSMLEGITSDLETQGDIKNTIIETGKDLLVGGIGGSLVGAVIGRLSLAIGAVVTGIGHYTKSRLTSMFGVGMMAGGAITPPTLAGKDDGDLMDGIKERALSFKDNLTHRLFLDNVLKSQQAAPATEQDTSGEQPVGEIKYFVYPGSEEAKPATELQGPEFDLTALDHLHQAVADSGEKYKLAQQAKSQEVSGELPEAEMGELDSEDRIY